MRLNDSLVESDVMEVARDFLTNFSTYELAALPEACRPARLAEGNDVAEYALALVRHRCDHGEADDYTVHRLSGFFSAAAARLSKIV